MRKIAIVSAMMAMLLPSVAGAQVKLTKDNIDKVIKEMTLEEKASLVVGAFNDYGDETTVPGLAGRTVPIKRLGIPSIILADGPMGLRIEPIREGDSRTYYCTAFPIGTAVASTWNTALIEQMGQVLGREVKDHGVDVLLGPGMNLQRNPLNGRNFEYYSEDPVITGKIAAAYVNGVQSQGVGTSIKHFAANQQETQRIINDSQVSARALRELYFKGFEICVKEASPWTVMSSYNRMNGPWTQENRELLTDVLRTDFGFRNLVVTDWTGTRNTVVQLHSGNDLFESGNDEQVADIIAGVKDGSLAIADLDLAVRRMLELIVKTQTFKGAEFTESVAPEAAEMARTVGSESAVLLKNAGNALPLASDAKKVALMGVESYDTQGAGYGAGNVNCEHIVTIAEGIEAAGYAIDDRLKKLYTEYVEYGKLNMEYNQWVRVHVGRPLVPETRISAKLMNKLAEEDDIAIVTIGRNSGECKDRYLNDDFNLTADEIEMLTLASDAFHKAGKKLVVILNVCGPVETASWKDKADAILCAWLPGQEAGYSIADVMTGKVNPSGRLPMTFPNDYFDLPSANDFPYDYHGKLSNNGGLKPDFTRPQVRNEDYTVYTEGIYVGYRWFCTKDKAVSYPFGYGLSYTSFEYSKPSVTVKGNKVSVQVEVKNVGPVAGKEAVGIYVSAPAGGLDKPAKELKAFGKTNLLTPGDSQVLTFDITSYDLASFNEDKSQWETAKGDYRVFIGADVSAPKAEASFSLKKASSWKTTHSCYPQEPIK